MAFYAPTVIEMVGTLDFDFVYLDGEHGTFTLSEIENCCRAAELCELTVIARVPGIDQIGNFLDRGVQGVIVPHVCTKEDIDRITEATFFKPRGNRSNAGARGDRYWIPVQDFDKHFEDANRNISICVQIEDMTAVTNLDAILAAGNVDYYVVGKNDLAQSLGVSRRKGAMVEKLDEAVKTIRDKVHKAGGRMNDDVMRLLWMREHLYTSAKYFLESDAADSYALRFGGNFR